MATRTLEIYAEIIQTLREGLIGEGIGNESIYLIAQPLPDDRSSIVIQVIPGVPRAQDARAAHGRIEESFDVVVWVAAFADAGVADTFRISDSTYSALAVIDKVRGVLIQNTLDDKVIVPVTFTRGSAASTAPLEHYGWVTMTDTYSLQYEIDWSRRYIVE